MLGGDAADIVTRKPMVGVMGAVAGRINIEARQTIYHLRGHSAPRLFCWRPIVSGAPREILPRRRAAENSFVIVLRKWPTSRGMTSVANRRLLLQLVAIGVCSYRVEGILREDI